MLKSGVLLTRGQPRFRHVLMQDLTPALCFFTVVDRRPREFGEKKQAGLGGAEALRTVGRDTIIFQGATSLRYQLAIAFPKLSDYC